MAHVSSRIDAATLDEVAQSLRHCKICPRDCGVDRTVSRHGAFCRLDDRAFVYRELLSVGEEAAISPTWLVDVGGCSMRCLFCSEWDHVVRPQQRPAVLLHAGWFLARLQERRRQGARTLSFVGGDPTVSLPAILAVLAQVPDAAWLPVVWNCNGWLSEAARRWLAPVVATWLVDVKFGNPACARRLAGIDGERNQLELRETLEFARHRGLMLRHLVLPGHLDCCTRPVLQWLARDFAQVPLNVMGHYLPAGPARTGQLVAAELGRLLGSEDLPFAPAGPNRGEHNSKEHERSPS